MHPKTFSDGRDLPNLPCKELDEIASLFKKDRPKLLELMRTKESAKNTAVVDKSVLQEPMMIADDDFEEGSRRRKRQPKPAQEKKAADIFGDDTDIVECPICCKSVYNRDINPHINSECTEGILKETPQQRPVFPPTPKTSANSVPTTQRRKDNRKPKASVPYDSYKPEQLRKLLREDGLRSTGDKALLKRRHREWVLIYNANLDTLEPKSDSYLRKEMDKWEALHGEGRDGRPVAAAAHSAGHELTPESEQAAIAHKERYQSEFSEMIEQLRKRRKIKASSDETVPNPCGEEKVGVNSDNGVLAPSSLENRLEV
ncbi:E3 ubiquitin-protein ligase rad18 [Chytridiales sp. JEL 0842]|nr:E3 ubiquitin-protein ligase rad18 [Chytridiales sp. JEL 0842]